MSVWTVVLIAIASFAVDYGRVQLTKIELQRAADAIALDVVTMYAESGTTAALAAAPTALAANKVDSASGLTPTMALTGGTWNTAAETFSAAYAPGVPAVQVRLSRSAAGGNPFQLIFTGLFGLRTCDLSATAIAALYDDQSGNVTVPSRANLHLAGMPGGSSSPWGDTTSNAAPYQVTTIAVVPGTWISIASSSGTTSILPGTLGYYGPDGEAGRKLNHGENQDGSDWGIGPENGIADAIIPAAALTGVFLTDGAPGGTAPATVDWTTAARQTMTAYDDIVVQQPFMIGDGRNPSGQTQRFLVPPGATRLYLSIWDGVVQSNNGGSLNATINVSRSIRLVR